MAQLGIGAMLHYLGGGSEHSPQEYLGRTITAAALIERDGGEGGDKQLVLTFSDGKRIAIFDDGQSCCERRYMTTDDDVADLVGHTLVRIESKAGAGASEYDHDDCHETCFVEIGTDQGFITLVNHNEHNGYYGGFGLQIVELEAS